MAQAGDAHVAQAHNLCYGRPICGLGDHITDIALCVQHGHVQMATQGLQESQHIAALTCFHGEEALYCHGFTINFDSELNVALA